MAEVRPTREDISNRLARCKEIYNPVRANYIEDERFYELAFKELLNLPQEKKNEGIIVPSARNFVDIQVDHSDITYASVSVGRGGLSVQPKEDRETLRKFGVGVLYMTNISTDISPWRVAAKHFWLHGLGVLQTLYNPANEEFPILIRAVNPYNVYPDPSYIDRKFIFEHHEKLLMDITGQWPKWNNPKDKKNPDDTVEYIVYWSKNFRYEEADGEPLLPGRDGIIRHRYGFLPYVFFESGLGNVTSDGDMAKRYVGILRYIKDMLVSESRNYSMNDIILKEGAWPWYLMEVAGGIALPRIERQYGTIQPVPEGTLKNLKTMTPEVPPDALRVHLGITSDYLAGHAAPRSLRGLPEQGVRSGADRRLILAEAGLRFGYAQHAFGNAAAKVLIHCAHIYKKLVPEDLLIWARTPRDTWDIEVKREGLKEPFNFQVEFKPVSEEDEYRRHDDTIRMMSAGIYSKSHARSKMPDIDPVALEFEEEYEKLRNDPAIQQLISQYASKKLLQALAQRGEAEMLAEPTPQTQPTPQPQPPGRRLVPPIPQRAPPQSAEEMENLLAQQRSQTPMSATQGQGGGGFRP